MRTQGRTAALAILVPAVLLAGLSALSLAGAATALPSDRTIELLRERGYVDPAKLDEAVATQLRAAKWFEPARYRTAAVSALAMLPPQTRAARVRNGDADAETLVRGALAAAPASPYNWARLADLRLAAGDRGQANRFWQMSVLTGRYVPGLIGPRLQIGFGLFPTTDEALIDLMSDQVRVAAAAEPRALAEAAEARYTAPFVRAVLFDDADLTKRFTDALGQLRGERDAAAEALRIERAKRARVLPQ